MDADPDVDLEAAAWLVADSIMRLRTKSATRSFDLWQRAATGGDPLNDLERPRIAPFIRTVFGLPNAAAPDDHAEGYVAEVVWFLLTRDLVDEGRTLRRIEEPSFYVTGPGGDGLVVFQADDGSLLFRLWEIKKHTGSRHLSATATRAMTQLSRNAPSYLAQYVSVAAHTDQQVADLYARLVDAWVDGDTCAGVGVAIGTSLNSAPKQRCFTGMQTHFPHLVAGDQLEGLVAAIADFPSFASRVRGFVWNVL
jgi:hypothetical protein